MTLYRYIERNPVRAELVESIADYRWSSYHANALGKKDPLVTEHPLYTALGKHPSARQRQYQTLFDEPVMKRQDEQIDTATMKGEVLGNIAFQKAFVHWWDDPPNLVCMEETGKARHGKIKLTDPLITQIRTAPQYYRGE